MKNLFKLKMGKVGAAGNGIINMAVGLLMIVAVLPVIFGTDGLANVDLIASAPSWLLVVLPVIIAGAVIKMVTAKK